MGAFRERIPTQPGAGADHRARRQFGASFRRRVGQAHRGLGTVEGELAGFGDRITVSIPATRAYRVDARGDRLRPQHSRRNSMTDARKIRWGILGPGTIARTFAGGVAPFAQPASWSPIGDARSRTSPARRGLPRRPHPRRLRGAARRSRGRRHLYRDAAPEPRRMGDQGRGGRQARAGRKADRRSPPSRPTR